MEAEWAAKEDADGLNRGSKRDEAEQHAFDDAIPVGRVGDFLDEFVVCLFDGAGGGEILPFLRFAVVDVLDVAGLEIGITFDDFVVFDNAAADTGREGKVERAPLEAVSLGESGKVGVVVHENRGAELGLEHGGEVEVVPVEIAEPDGFVVLDDAGHGDRDSLET